MDISDLIDATNQEVLTFVGVRGFMTFFDNYLARQLPSWLTSVIRNDEFYLSERVTMQDLDAAFSQARTGPYSLTHQ